MQPLHKILALLSLPVLLAGYFVAFNVFMFGGLAMLFAFSSACSSYGACLTASNTPWVIAIAIGLVAAVFVMALWTKWVADMLDWPWLTGKRRQR
ncbi:putative membrane protein [Asticcacaulis biprosthecium C19]|uniref:Putative membrane protein n=1 Tax=Asticcacaulis biprosthecium C19 TaxID=715226 RepID=F4QP01_9CAUL|nr:hypothetical protein [Asticcacaulis biprosthecium]EGF91059.1 putative membrane protein [Asticcacaulis biprosthecium C19]